MIYLFQHLNNLLENYLEPLKKETFLSQAEIGALFGNIQEIVSFQRQFLQNLEEALEMEPDFHKFDHSSQFKVRVSVSFSQYNDYVVISFLNLTVVLFISECIIFCRKRISLLC